MMRCTAYPDDEMQAISSMAIARNTCLVKLVFELFPTVLDLLGAMLAKSSYTCPVNAILENRKERT